MYNRRSLLGTGVRDAVVAMASNSWYTVEGFSAGISWTAEIDNLSHFLKSSIQKMCALNTVSVYLLR